MKLVLGMEVGLSPIQFVLDGDCVGDVLGATQSIDESRRRILDRLETLKQVGRQVDQQTVTVIQQIQNECRD